MPADPTIGFHYTGGNFGDKRRITKLVLREFDLGEPGDPRVQGYDTGRYWNGWACPVFTAAQLPAVIAMFRRLGYRVGQTDECVTMRHESGEGEAKFNKIVIQGVSYWDGGGCFTWDEVDGS